MEIIDDDIVQLDPGIIFVLLSYLITTQYPEQTSVTVISVENNDMSSASLEVVGVVGNDIRLEEGDNVTLRVTLDLAFDRATTIQIVTTGDRDPG